MVRDISNRSGCFSTANSNAGTYRVSRRKIASRLAWRLLAVAALLALSCSGAMAAATLTWNTNSTLAPVDGPGTWSDRQ